MLLNNENVDYLLEWPAHYYEIEDINERERILQLAIEQKLDPALDEKRLLILRKRFGDHPAKNVRSFSARMDDDTGSQCRWCILFSEKKTEKRTLWISYAARYPDR